MSTARKLRAELAAYLEPYGLSVEPSGTGAGFKSTPGLRSSGVAVFDGDRSVGVFELNNPNAVVAAVKALHKLRPQVPELVVTRPPRASRSRKPVEEPALSLPPARAPQVEDGEQHDEAAAAFVQALAEDMPTTQAPPAQAVEAAARRLVPGAGWAPGRLFGCDVIARVRLVAELEQGLPSALFDAAADGLAQHRPTWLVRDPDGRLAVLVTNHQAAA